MVLGELGRFVSVGLVAATAAAEPGAVSELSGTVVAVSGIDLVTTVRLAPANRLGLTGSRPLFGLLDLPKFPVLQLVFLYVDLSDLCLLALLVLLARSGGRSSSSLLGTGSAGRGRGSRRGGDRRTRQQGGCGRQGSSG